MHLQIFSYFQFFQVNVKSYKARPNAKDFIQVEILVERNSQKPVVIGKVRHLYQISIVYL
jgi:GTPase Era involved in 16S rRNA processing